MEWGGVEAWGIERGAVHSYGVSPYCTAKVPLRAHSLYHFAEASQAWLGGDGRPLETSIPILVRQNKFRISWDCIGEI